MPMVERRRKERTEFWAETLQHISNSWQAKKKRPYPFTGQDLKLIKHMRSWFTAPEVWALWTCYLLRSPFWGQKTGYLVSGFWSERSILLEDSEFKRLTAKYEHDLGMKEAKQVVLELGIK